MNRVKLLDLEQRFLNLLDLAGKPSNCPGKIDYWVFPAAVWRSLR